MCAVAASVASIAGGRVRLLALCLAGSVAGLVPSATKEGAIPFHSLIASLAAVSCAVLSIMRVKELEETATSVRSLIRS